MAWSITFAIAAGLQLCLGIYHWLVLPAPATDVPRATLPVGQFFAEFAKTFGTFFQKPKIVTLLGFLLLYRLGEAQLVKIIPLFLLDTPQQGGLGLSNGQISWIYGTVGADRPEDCAADCSADWSFRGTA